MYVVLELSYSIFFLRTCFKARFYILYYNLFFFFFSSSSLCILFCRFFHSFRFIGLCWAIIDIQKGVSYSHSRI